MFPCARPGPTRPTASLPGSRKISIAWPPQSAFRVVRIGESPLAPLFEVIERPNNWDRQLAQQKRSVEAGLSDLG